MGFSSMATFATEKVRRKVVQRAMRDKRPEAGADNVCLPELQVVLRHRHDQISELKGACRIA